MRALAMLGGLVVLVCVPACGGGGAPPEDAPPEQAPPSLEVSEARAKMVQAEGGRPRMEIHFTATNKTAKSLDWKPRGASFIRDFEAKNYRPQWGSPARSIGPGESAELMLACDVPPKKARRFILWLDGKSHLGVPARFALAFERPEGPPPEAPPPEAPPAKD